MKTVKMSLASVQGKLSRMEMKSIIAGNGDEEIEGGCIKKRGLCSKSEECCGLLACTNIDGEQGSFRCNGI